MVFPAFRNVGKVDHYSASVPGDHRSLQEPVPDLRRLQAGQDFAGPVLAPGEFALTAREPVGTREPAPAGLPFPPDILMTLPLMYTRSTGFCLLLVLLPLACTTQSPAPEAPADSSGPAGSVVAVEVVRARKEAAAKPRRIIFNDDGGDLHDAESSTPEGFLGIRLKRLAGTQVDTVAWSITKGDAPNYDSRIQPVFGPATPIRARVWVP